VVWFYRNKTQEAASAAGTVALDTKLDWVRKIGGRTTTHPSNVVLDALDDYVDPSREVLSNHRQSMNGRLGVLGEATELMSIELAELDRI
jgi:hypothetical protein